MTSPSPLSCPPALEVSHISKSFAGNKILEDISFSIPAGQAVALLGENGAGKTTLMRLCCGVSTPDSGSIRICGHDTILPQSRENLGYLPENASPLPGYRVLEALHFFAELHGLKGVAAEKAIASVINRCELSPVCNRICEQLSKGYRHRLGLAQAMLHTPKLMLLDEPTDGLDPQQKKATQQLLKQLAGNCAIMLSTHLLFEVPEICDRVIILARHGIAYDGPVPENLPQTFSDCLAPSGI